VSTPSIYNYIQVDEHFSTAGQPREEELVSAAQEGFRAVINLAPIDPRYSLKDEPGLVRSLGMAYHHIPVPWDNPQESDFEAFENIMQALPEGKTLIHCAANFRASAFYSLYALKHLGWSADRAAQFRASIWKGSDNPIWEAFIRRIEASNAAP
jgi:uncharacterized protein (TIGR01244 family)